MGPVLGLLVAAPLAALQLVLAAGDPSAPSVSYRAPVPGPVIDPYRPPSTPYGPGNRGLEYATTPGEPVGAPADGDVTFAGPVAGGLHVVVLHADGVRTSMSFLAAVLVRRGQRVAAGEAVGVAGATLHFGARRGEAYIDPASLLVGEGGGRAVLVSLGPGRSLDAAAEAAGLRRLLAAGGSEVAPPAPVARAPSAAGRQRMQAVLQAAAVGGPPVVAAAALGLRTRPGRRAVAARPGPAGPHRRGRSRGPACRRAAAADRVGRR